MKAKNDLDSKSKKIRIRYGTVLTKISQERDHCLEKFKKLEAASNMVETQQYASDVKSARKRTEKLRKKCFKLFSAHEQNITDATVEQQWFQVSFNAKNINIPVQLVFFLQVSPRTSLRQIAAEGHKSSCFKDTCRFCLR